MQYTADVGEAFARASELEAYEGWSVHNLDGPEVSMTELVELIRGLVPDADLSAAGDPLPFPSSVDGSSFVELTGGSVMRPIGDGVRESVERFREMLADGRVKPPTAHRDAG
jgi:hypothetical protein